MPLAQDMRHLTGAARLTSIFSLRGQAYRRAWFIFALATSSARYFFSGRSRRHEKATFRHAELMLITMACADAALLRATCWPAPRSAAPADARRLLCFTSRAFTRAHIKTPISADHWLLFLLP